MTDQQRADFLAGEGFALDTMPFTESLAARGARFRHADTPLPTCVPARCSTFTGRFPKATRVRENSAAHFIPSPSSADIAAGDTISDQTRSPGEERRKKLKEA